MRYLSLILICLHSASLVKGQGEALNWHFGNSCHLFFQSGSPTAGGTPSTIPAGTLSAIPFAGGSANVSDSTGGFLFVVDQVRIANMNPSNLGSLMAGCTGVTNDADQGVISIRKGGKRYYVVHSTFVNSGVAPILSYIRYEEVDMALSAGLGSVTSTQNTLSAPGLYMLENITATRHCNKTDHWILAHEMNNNKFHAYLATGSSINPNPVISAVGSVAYNYALGNPLSSYYNKSFSKFKFSPNGRKLAVTLPYRSVEVFDFDNATGVVSNSLVLDGNYVPGATSTLTDQASHGIEFSPDGTKLYVSYVNNHPFICQFDLCAGSPSAIAASKTVISNTVLPALQRSELQNGPDGKIYVAHPNSSTIGVINNPNAAGLACNYAPNSVSLGSNPTPSLMPVCGQELTYFISNYFEQKPVLPPLSSSIACGNAQFTAPTLCAATGYSITGHTWRFGDALSGAANSSTLANPAHVFSANGTYTVKLTLQYPCGADTLKQVVTITGLPTLSVSGKTSICKGEKTLLTLAGAATYSLNGAALPQSTTAPQPTASTVYTLSGTGQSGCSAKTTLSLSVLPCLAVTEADTEQFGFSLFPNPTGGETLISTNQPLDVYVYDALGRLMLQKTIAAGSTHLQTENFAKGVYFVRAENNSGRIKTVKLLKE